MAGAHQQTHSSAAGFHDELPARILDYFHESLPALDHTIIQYRVLSKASGKATTNQKLPIALIQYPHDAWTRAGQNAIDEVRNDDENSIIRELRAPRSFRELQLRSETDVVAASAIYIISPILEVLHRRYPGRFEVYNELSEVTSNYEDEKGQSVEDSSNPKKSASPKSKKQKRGHDEMDDEDYAIEDEGDPNGRSSSTVRLDLCWRSKESGDKIAVIEFKKRGQIRAEDYEKAIIPAKSKDMNRKLAAWQKAKTKPRRLQKNAVWHTKQVTAYAVRTNCPYVALFNWDHLLLFKWKKSDIVSDNLLPNNNSGPSVSFTWVNDSEETKIRLALLGWLDTAFKDGGF
jgi:hypothetical protein